jgi:2-enoate reductase
MVAGGGIAGMEAARLAALLGHNVTIYEKEDRLGGHLIESTVQDFKADEEKYFKWILKQLDKSSVRILLNTPVISDTIKKEKPDFLIIAVGSEYQKPNIKGAENAVIAEEVLEGTFAAGENIAVIGGGIVGSETTLALARNNHKVTIIEMAPEIASRHESSTQQSLISQLQKAKVQILVNHTVEEIGAGYVKAKDDKGNTAVIKADTSILATGLVSRGYQELSGIVPNGVIGDCMEPRKIFECTHEAWKTVREYLSESYIKEI